MFSNRKVIGTLIAVFSILTLLFIILKNIELAIVFMCVLFTLTNGMRARSFNEKGFVRESKWMKWIAVFFALGAVVLLILYIF